MRWWRVRSVLLAALVVVLGAAMAVTPNARAQDSGGPAPPLRVEGRWLVDSQGRVVVLHGVNQVRKLPPYLPSAVGFGADDAAAIAAEGFNTVRTGVAHVAVAPQPGEYDQDYLDGIAATVDTLAAAGLYVLVDAHQDLYSERYQGNGMALWATVDSFPGDPTTVPQCALGFPANIFTCNFLWEAFDRFLGLSGRPVETGPRGITLQEEFAEAWQQVASALGGRPMLLGYDIFNEPYPGSQVLVCLAPPGCPPQTDAALTDFSNGVAEAIRAVDAESAVFYEPYSTNFNAGFPTRHGDVGVDNVGFSFHVYACPFAIPGVPVPDPGLSEHCDDLRERDVFENANSQAATYGHAPLLTEFGATDDLGTIRRIADLADEHMVGWQYWAWWNEDPCCERPDEGIIDHPSNPPTGEHLDQAKLLALNRPYPRAVAGTPTGWRFDEEQPRFELAYSTQPVGGPLAEGALSEVWVPRRHYPDGYRVVELSGGEVVSEPGAERLLVRASEDASAVSFAVVAGDSGASGRPSDGEGAGPERATGADPVGTSGRGTLPATGGSLLTLAGLAGVAAGLSARDVTRRAKRGTVRPARAGETRHPRTHGVMRN